MFTVWMIGLACSSHTVHHEAYGSSRESSEVCARGVCSRYMPAPLRWTSTVNLYSEPLRLSIPSASPFSVCFYFWYFLNSNKISDEFLLGLRESANAGAFWFWCNGSYCRLWDDAGWTRKIAEDCVWTVELHLLNFQSDYSATFRRPSTLRVHNLESAKMHLL